MQKFLVLTAVVNIASSAFANSALGETIKTDAGLAGKTFCWSAGWDNEKYNRDHSYVYTYHPTFSINNVITLKGTWAISNDGAVTVKLSDGSIQHRRYDMIDGEHVKELTNSFFNYGGGPGKRC